MVPPVSIVRFALARNKGNVRNSQVTVIRREAEMRLKASEGGHGKVRIRCEGAPVVQDGMRSFTSALVALNAWRYPHDPVLVHEHVIVSLVCNCYSCHHHAGYDIRHSRMHERAR